MTEYVSDFYGQALRYVIGGMSDRCHDGECPNELSEIVQSLSLNVRDALALVESGDPGVGDPAGPGTSLKLAIADVADDALQLLAWWFLTHPEQRYGGPGHGDEMFAFGDSPAFPPPGKGQRAPGRGE